MNQYTYITGFFNEYVHNNDGIKNSEISHHNLFKSPNLGCLKRFFSLYTPEFYPLNHKSTTNLDTKYLYKNSYGYYYLNIRVKDKIFKFSLKTQDRYCSIERRNKILSSLNTSNTIEHDKITLSITLKILGIQKMFEYLSEDDYQEHLRQEEARGTLEERLKRKVEIDKIKQALQNQILEDEQKCHILYYRGSKPNQNTATLNHLQKNHVLVISDDADDAKRGGMFSFYIQNNAYRFIINQRNLHNAELTASYKLLNFATVIDPVGR